jgi:hypothetical protein
MGSRKSLGCGRAGWSWAGCCDDGWLLLGCCVLLMWRAPCGVQLSGEHDRGNDDRREKGKVEARSFDAVQRATLGVGGEHRGDRARQRRDGIGGERRGDRAGFRRVLRELRRVRGCDQAERHDVQERRGRRDDGRRGAERKADAGDNAGEQGSDLSVESASARIFTVDLGRDQAVEVAIIDRRTGGDRLVREDVASRGRSSRSGRLVPDPAQRIRLANVLDEVLRVRRRGRRRHRLGRRLRVAHRRQA